MRLQGLKILIVDDEPMIRELVRGDLELEGASVSEACDGFVAIEEMKKTVFDFVVSDVRMPKTDGIALLKEKMSSFGKAPPLLFISGFAEVTESEVKSQGALGILTKPFDSEMLIENILNNLPPKA